MASRRIRIGAALVALCTATAVGAQAFNQAVLRYRAEQSACGDTYRERIARNCDAACRAAADTARQSCLAKSEERYREVLRRRLQTRN